MSEMGDWINQLAVQGAFTRPPNENVAYGDPVTNAGNVIAEKPMASPGGNPLFSELYGTAPAPAAPETPMPGAPAAGAPAAGGMAPLEAFLRYYTSGYGDLPMTQEMYNHFGGDSILQQLLPYNPGAQWVDAEIGGGEGGAQGMGKKLVFADGQLHAPAPKYGMDLMNLRPSNFTDSGLINPNFKWDDDVYGSVTDSRNIKKAKPAWWEYAAPVAISLLAPMAGAALAAGGIGAGAAGATSAITGGAAGLGAANIPGAAAAGAAGGATPWWATKAPQVGRQALNYFNPHTPQAPPRPVIPRAAADAYGFDPSAFNAGGSATKPTNNDSSLVATRFAADPYGFSKGY